MASPEVFMKLSMDFLKRNNPIEILAMNLAQWVYNLVTFNSRMKLLKYNFLLARQKLSRMQETLEASDPGQYQGHKINKIY